jgi:hypothetical protein
VARNTSKAQAYCKKHPKDTLLKVGEKVGR